MSATFNPRFASRVRDLVQSDIRRMTRECEKAGGINLGQGICDQPVPEIIKRAAGDAIDADLSVYSKFEGIDALRRRIAAKMQFYNDVRCDPDTQVVVTVGSTGGFAIACLALLEPGDEVVVFSPFYSYHLNLLRLVGAQAKFVRMRPPDWQFDETELQAAFTSRTRMVVINTPSNPSGKVFRRDELEAVGRLCAKWGAVALTDEIYEYILYDGRAHVSMASLPGMEDRTITLSGFSKTYSMTGWRLGYAVAEPSIAGRLGVVNDLLYICAPTPLQHGVVAAFDLPESYYDDLRLSYTGKLEALSSACEEAGLKAIRPQGSYYLLADVSGLGVGSDREASVWLLANAGVTSIPGSSFHADPADGRDQVRFCFAKKPKDLDEACGRLRALRR
ncbi:MAG TPA: aminotransferase class I/II-fold pyridoxal phosphate-dependent enzyme [Candidatus Polarisedimenticolia bacterium]|nr:aminotransferase class I/II-fold pyridoxal phosphate-dependent enzyme [Candidatus Polarisedimenticolia bacterium]